MTDRSQDRRDWSAAAAEFDASLRGTRAAIPRLLLQALKRGFRRVEQAAQTGRAGRGRLRADHGLHDRVRAARALPARPQAAGGPAARNPVQSAARRCLRRASREKRWRPGSTALEPEVETLVGRLEAQPAGRFGPAFFASLVTIVREGVEVILILAMLLALVGKATSAAGLRAPAGRIAAPATRARRAGSRQCGGPAQGSGRCGRSGGAWRRPPSPASRPRSP